MLAYRVLRAADRLWQAYAVTFTRKVKRSQATEKGGGSRNGPNTRSCRARRFLVHPPRLRALSTPSPGASITHTTHRAGRNPLTTQENRRVNGQNGHFSCQPGRNHVGTPPRPYGSGFNGPRAVLKTLPICGEGIAMPTPRRVWVWAWAAALSRRRVVLGTSECR